jgi:hypothetical protein
MDFQATILVFYNATLTKHLCSLLFAASYITVAFLFTSVKIKLSKLHLNIHFLRHRKVLSIMQTNFYRVFRNITNVTVDIIRNLQVHSVCKVHTVLVRKTTTTHIKNQL